MSKLLNLINTSKLYLLEKDFFKSYNIMKNYNISYNLMIKLRRYLYGNNHNLNISKTPFSNFNYKQIYEKNNENTIGYVRVPVGIAGPLIINEKEFFAPIATTEGALIGSINRGCKIITDSGKNIKTTVIQKGITRSPIIEFENIQKIPIFLKWLNENKNDISEIFNSTSSVAKFKDITTLLAGNKVHLRFQCYSGDAMGMNIISKGTDKVLEYIKTKFNIKVISISGNTCTDKKASSINWINGRSNTVLAETFLSKEIIKNKLKINYNELIKLNIDKNLVGSSLAGTIGGNNSHVANIVSGFFLSTGQDTAQIGTSSFALTQYEDYDDEYIRVNLTMPSLELGTIGGGTDLNDQIAYLNVLNIDKKDNVYRPGHNTKKLCEIIGGFVLAGEISLMASLAYGNLVSSHMNLNRRKDI